jgi:hypothetical protein
MKTKIASQKHKLKWKKKILLFYILNYETRKHKEDAIKKKKLLSKLTCLF